MPVTDQQFNALRQIVITQGNLIVDLQNKLKELLDCCKCPTCPEYRSANVDFFNTEGDPYWGNPYINLNDRFPLPACADQKGILFLNDATLYCRFAYEYNPDDPNSGWIIDDYQRGGRNR